MVVKKKKRVHIVTLGLFLRYFIIRPVELYYGLLSSSFVTNSYKRAIMRAYCYVKPVIEDFMD